MKITISISKKESEHLKKCLNFYDSCENTQNIMNKVKDKILKKRFKK